MHEVQDGSIMALNGARFKGEIDAKIDAPIDGGATACRYIKGVSDVFSP
jgi:hypothetical protein